MAFNNIPPNGFPALPDIEDLEAVEKDVATLKNGLTSKIDSQIYNETTRQSDDDAIKGLFDDIDIYDKPIAGAMGYGGWWLYIAYKYTGGNHGCLVAFRFDGAAKFLFVNEGVKTIRPFAFGS